MCFFPRAWVPIVVSIGADIGSVAVLHRPVDIGCVDEDLKNTVLGVLKPQNDRNLPIARLPLVDGPLLWLWPFRVEPQTVHTKSLKGFIQCQYPPEAPGV